MRNRGGWILPLVLISALWAANGTERQHVTGQRFITGPANSPFQMPSDCTVGLQGQLYVLDGVQHRVMIYDANGSFLSQFGSVGSGAAQLHFPLGIDAAPDGTLYIADSGNHRIQIFSALGRALGSIDLPPASDGPTDPTGVAIDAQRGRLYIADNDNHRILPYDLMQQKLLPAWGSPGQGRRQFRYPFLLDTSTDGYVLIVEPINTRVQVLNDQGKFVNFVGAWGTKAGQLFRPKGIAVTNGHLYVSDSYLGRIQVFRQHGDFLGVLTDRQDNPITLTTPMGMALDEKRGRLYVVELKANRVTCLELK